MSTMGFLALLDQDEALKYENNFQVRSDNTELPPFLRRTAAAARSDKQLIMPLAEVFAPRKSGGPGSPTPREWDEYSRWLTEVIKAQPRTIEREVGKRTVCSARMCIFLAFYRQGIPINSIKPAQVLPERTLAQQGRAAWSWAQWIEVPIMKQSTGLSTEFSNTWWLQKNHVAVPASLDYARVPKAVLCHRFQTSQLAEDPALQDERSEADRKRLALSLTGRSGETLSMLDLKDANSEWGAEALEKFVAQMNLQGDESSDSPVSEQGMNLVEGYLKRRGNLGWSKYWYVLTGGTNVPGMLSEYNNSEFTFKPRHVLYLRHCTVNEVTQINGKACKKNTFAINRRDKQPIFLRAHDKKEMSNWISNMLTYTEIINLNLDLELFSTPSVASTEKGIIVEWNTASEQLFGYTKAEAIGKNVKILMPKEIAKRHNDYIQRYIKSSERIAMGKPRMVTIVKKDGSRQMVQITLGEYFHRSQRRFFATFCDEAMAAMSVDDAPTLSVAPQKRSQDDSSLWGDTFVAVAQTDDELSEAWSDEEVESPNGSSASTSSTSTTSTTSVKARRTKTVVD